MAVAPEFRATHTDMAAVLQATPQRYRPPAVRSEVRSVWSAQALRGAGPVWSSRENALYWVDTAGRQLHRFHPQHKLRDSWSFDESIGAVAECVSRPGLLLALRHELAVFDPDSGRLQRLHQAEPAQPANRFGDGRCDVRGRFWVSTRHATSQVPSGALYRYTGGSRCQRLQSGIGPSHGPAWSLDHTTLFMTDAAQRRVLACDFDADKGTLGVPRTWLQLAPGEGQAQGLCTDAAGRIWIARSGAGFVSSHDPDTSEELLRITIPAKQVTACTFGGPDLRTLFITSASQQTSDAGLLSEPLAGALFAVEVDSPGLPAHLFVG